MDLVSIRPRVQESPFIVKSPEPIKYANLTPRLRKPNMPEVKIESIVAVKEQNVQLKPQSPIQIKNTIQSPIQIRPQLASHKTQSPIQVKSTDYRLGRVEPHSPQVNQVKQYNPIQTQYSPQDDQVKQYSPIQTQYSPQANQVKWHTSHVVQVQDVSTEPLEILEFSSPEDLHDTVVREPIVVGHQPPAPLEFDPENLRGYQELRMSDYTYVQIGDRVRWIDELKQFSMGGVVVAIYPTKRRGVSWSVALTLNNKVKTVKPYKMLQVWVSQQHRVANFDLWQDMYDFLRLKYGDEFLKFMNARDMERKSGTMELI